MTCEFYVREFILMRARDLPRVREGYMGEPYTFKLVSTGPLSHDEVRQLAFDEIARYVGPDDVEDLYIVAKDDTPPSTE